jgi:ferric-dicitrate binding protein FerR (iron transport regulator)
VTPHLRQIATALCIAFFLACSSDKGPRVAESPKVAPVARARLKRLVGQVLVKRAAGDDWAQAKDAMELFENDKVRTVAGASAVLEFANGSSVSLGEDALIGISETHLRPGQDHTDLTLLKGHIDAALDKPAQQSLSVTTPSATVRAGREIVFQ